MTNTYDGASRESLIHEVNRLEETIKTLRSISNKKTGRIKRFRNTNKKLIDAGMALVCQVEDTGHSDHVGYKDQFGHDLRMNVQYQEFNNLVAMLSVIKEEDK